MGVAPGHASQDAVIKRIYASAGLQCTMHLYWSQIGNEIFRLFQDRNRNRIRGLTASSGSSCRWGSAAAEFQLSLRISCRWVSAVAEDQLCPAWQGQHQQRLFCQAFFSEKILLYCFYLKGIVQRILGGVKNKLKKSVLANWRPARFSFWILKGHHHKRSRKSFSAAEWFVRWLCLIKLTFRNFQSP
jgi:hypothetical protein